MAVEVRNSSRLLFADLLTDEGVEFWDTLVLPDARAREDDIQYVVANGDRIDLIADRFYQDSRLWWVVAWANNLEIIPTDLKEGQQLRIPSTDFVETELLGRARRRA